MNRFSPFQKAMFSILLILGVSFGLWAMIHYFPGSSNQGYIPEQPIAFSHKLHAGTHQINCNYCHSSASVSRHSSVPPVALCVGCHSVVKTDSPEVKKILTAFAEGRPIEWIRIHELPDHVYFPHKRHIAAGLACQECHGNVQNMERVYQYSALNMGWCMNCHRGDTAPQSILKAKYPSMNHPKGPVAPFQCNTCHY